MLATAAPQKSGTGRATRQCAPTRRVRVLSFPLLHRYRGSRWKRAFAWTLSLLIVPSGERNMPQTSPDLLTGRVSSLPPGFRYQPELISDAEERRLLEELGKLDFKPFE